jgi:hypothetical protein
MKSISNANRPLQVPLLAVALSINVVVHAQPLPASTGLPTDAPSAMPAASAVPPVQSLPDSGPTANAPASTAAPAAVPAEQPAASPPAMVPVASDSSTSSILPPVSKDALEKKKKKGKAGRKAKKGKSDLTRGESDPMWGDPWGDSQDELRAAGLSFKFLLQTHYQQTFAFSSRNPIINYRIPEETLVRHNDGWDVNRLFFRIAAEPSRYLSLKMILDLAEFMHNNPKQVAKQAYADISPIPKHLHFQVGVLKLPYSITELDPIATYEFSHMGEANNLVKGLGFAGRDIGAEVVVEPLAKPRYLKMALGAFRGHAHDEQGRLFGALGARVETHPVKSLRLGVDWVEQPNTITYLNPFDSANKNLLPNPENPNFPRSSTWQHGRAFSGDISFERMHLTLRMEGMVGTRVDYDTQYGAKKFAAFWALAAYKFPVGPVQLQPGMRAEWLDTDTQHNNGLHRQLTLGLATYFSDSIRLLLDVTRTYVQENSPEVNQPIPLRAIPYDALSNTRVTGQVQVIL